MWKVRDIMRRDVVRIRPEASVRELILLLAQEQISGVPVVDHSGEIVGVVSTTDILQLAAQNIDAPMRETRWRHSGRDILDEESAASVRQIDAPFQFEEPDPLSLGVPELAEYRVEDIMTPAAFTVDLDTTVAQLSRFMLQGRIHRALVVERGRLEGIVTAYDVLRAAAENVEKDSVKELMS
jgi:CBS domain-containing protein